jgi:PTS system ascorbate-specific IIA component
MKTRILIMAHAPLASALRICAAHVFPEQMQAILALDVMPDTKPQDSLTQAQRLLEGSERGPLLVLTDIQGATPCNVARQLVRGRHARIVAGANMPMLLRAVTYQDEALESLVQRVLAGGAQGVQEIKRPEDDE